MHPVMLTIPGWAFKAIVPLLILWGMYSIIVSVNRASPPPPPPKKKPARAKRTEATNSTDSTDSTEDTSTKAPTESSQNSPPPRSFNLPADTPLNALISIAIGLGVFGFAAHVAFSGSAVDKLLQLLRAFASGVVWRAPWQSLPIYSYGVMLGLSLVVGWYVVLGLTERQGLPRDKMADCYVFTAFVAVIGSRVLYILTNLSEFPTLWSMLQLRSGGLVAYGGFLGGLLGSILYLRSQRMPLWPWADAAVPALGSGIMITRLGCYMYGCDFGGPLPAGAPSFLRRLGTFPHWADNAGSPAWYQHVHQGFTATRDVCERVYHGEFHSDGLCHIARAATASAPVHPTQLYESLVGATIFVTLLWLWRRRAWQGQIFLAFAILYGIARPILEIIRDDAERGAVGPLSTSQFIGIVSVLIAVPLYIYRSKKAERALPVDLFAPVDKQPGRTPPEETTDKETTKEAT